MKIYVILEYLVENMTITKQAQDINNFVVDFLDAHGVDSKLWLASENMKKFKSLFHPTRKVKDKDKPKRASSAYLYFCQAKRPSVKEQLGKDSGATQVTTELGRMWRELKNNPDCDTLMAPYQKLAEKDRARYNKEMASYVPPTQEELKKKRKRTKSGPKRARSAYIFFCSEKRAQAKKNLEGQDANAKDVTAELGRMWREFKNSGNQKEMNKYLQLHEEDKKRFETESLAYVPEEIPSKPLKKATVPPPHRSVVSPRKSSLEKVTPKKSSSKKLVAYRLYVKTKRPELKAQFPKMTAREITSTLGKQWKSLSDSEKQEWEQ